MSATTLSDNTSAQCILTSEQLAQFERDGFVIARGLISPNEIHALREHFDALHAAGPARSPQGLLLFDPLSAKEAGNDPLKRYPRFMHPHRVDEFSKHLMLDARIAAVLREIMCEEPIATQSMFYWKPPGGRGQALHQDNFYLAVRPGTCTAAWLAVDDVDEENGGLFVVPGSHKTAMQCPHVADMTKSFAAEEVDVPTGLPAPIPANLKAGDMLFFNGSMIHGSTPNESRDRFRRSFICHYMPASAQEISPFYFPLHDFSGNVIERAASHGGGPCGTEEMELLRRQWTEQPVG